MLKIRGSNLGWNTIQRLEITEENVLPISIMRSCKWFRLSNPLDMLKYDKPQALRVSQLLFVKKIIKDNGKATNSKICAQCFWLKIVVCDCFSSADVDRAPVAQLVEHQAVTREVVSSALAGPTVRVFK